MNTAERTEVQVTDLRKWLKGKSRLNNELAIRLRAKLAMFSDLIQQIREKARLVYRDGDARFKTYSLEKLMEVRCRSVAVLCELGSSAWQTGHFCCPSLLFS